MDEPVEPQEITVGDLIRQLKTCDPDKPLHFGCEELEFNRVKDRGSHVQIEFSQSVYLDRESPDFRVVVEHHGRPKVGLRPH